MRLRGRLSWRPLSLKLQNLFVLGERDGVEQHRMRTSLAPDNNVRIRHASVLQTDRLSFRAGPITCYYVKGVRLWGASSFVASCWRCSSSFRSCRHWRRMRGRMHPANSISMYSRFLGRHRFVRQPASVTASGDPRCNVGRGLIRSLSMAFGHNTIGAFRNSARCRPHGSTAALFPPCSISCRRRISSSTNGISTAPAQAWLARVL